MSSVNSPRCLLLSVLMVACGCPAIAQTSRGAREPLRRWIVREYPDWDKANVEGLMTTYRDTIAEAGEELSEGDVWTIEEAVKPYLLKRLPDRPDAVVPAQLDVIREELRLSIRSYVERPAVSEADRAKASRQLDGLLREASDRMQRTLRDIGLSPDDPAIERILEYQAERVDNARKVARHPLIPFFKRPLTETEMKEVRARLDRATARLARLSADDVRDNPRRAVYQFHTFLPDYNVSSPELMRHQKRTSDQRRARNRELERRHRQRMQEKEREGKPAAVTSPI